MRDLLQLMKVICDQAPDLVMLDQQHPTAAAEDLLVPSLLAVWPRQHLSEVVAKDFAEGLAKTPERLELVVQHMVCLHLCTQCLQQDQLKHLTQVWHAQHSCCQA